MAGKYRDLYYFFNRHILSLLPEKIHHNVLGFIMHRRFNVKYHWMNMSHPKTFSEKLQWLKTHGDIELKTRLADKYDVRDWVAERIGNKYLIDLLPITKSGGFIASSTDEIDFNNLPNEFALKLTKGSGYNIICKDKTGLNIGSACDKLNRWLKVDNYFLSRELQYRGKNRIICERMLEYNITDYKFFCFNGEPKYVELYIDRFGKHKKVFYDMQWRKAGFTTGNDPMNGTAERPKEFNEMMNVARKLSKGFSFVRVDLYVHGGNVYFGEMTFHPAGGYTPITPREWEFKLGEMLQI